jgi:hypothetical protein
MLSGAHLSFSRTRSSLASIRSSSSGNCLISIHFIHWGLTICTVAGGSFSSRRCFTFTMFLPALLLLLPALELPHFGGYYLGRIKFYAGSYRRWRLCGTERIRFVHFAVRKGIIIGAGVTEQKCVFETAEPIYRQEVLFAEFTEEIMDSSFRILGSYGCCHGCLFASGVSPAGDTRHDRPPIGVSVACRAARLRPALRHFKFDATEATICRVTLSFL